MAIEPAQTPENSTLKFAGRVIRNTIHRESYAECMEDDCDSAWQGAGAIVASGMHTVGSGHRVNQFYEAAYELTPNPNHDDWQIMGGAKQKAERLRKNKEANYNRNSAQQL